MCGGLSYDFDYSFWILHMLSFDVVQYQVDDFPHSCSQFVDTSCHGECVWELFASAKIETSLV